MIDLARRPGSGRGRRRRRGPRHWEVLAALGCDLAQGYYFSRPLPAEDLAALDRQFAAPRTGDAERAPDAEAALVTRVRERGVRLTAEAEFIARKRAESA